MAHKKTYKTQWNLLEQSANRSKNLDQTIDKALVGKYGTSIALKKDNVTLASGLYSNLSMDTGTGIYNELSLRSNVITVVRDISVNDLLINNHKLNSQLYELTNMKNVNGEVIGNLTMYGTVLVKTWEPTLQKYVLMRRKIRMPVFSNLLDAYYLDEKLGVDFGNSYNIFNYKIKKDNSKVGEDTKDNTATDEDQDSPIKGDDKETTDDKTTTDNKTEKKDTSKEDKSATDNKDKTATNDSTAKEGETNEK